MDSVLETAASLLMVYQSNAGTLAATRMPARRNPVAINEGGPMNTITLHLALATSHGLRAGQLVASASSIGLLTGHTALLVVILIVLLVAVMARAMRAIATFVSELLQAASAIVAAFNTIVLAVAVVLVVVWLVQR
jgi:hypothetical protein